MKFLIFIILIIRLLLIFTPSFKIDMSDWQAWAQRLVDVTPIHFYAPDYFSDYFPGYLYILWFLGKSFNFVAPHIPIFGIGFEFYLKLLTNFFDIGTAYYIYKIVVRYRKNMGLTAVFFYLANPALFFNSSVWGQVDGILTFFLVLAAYYIIELKNLFKFIIAFSLSILIKPQGLAVLPIMFVYLIKNYHLKKISNLLLIPFLLILLSLPFFLKDPIFGLFNLFLKSTSIYPYTSMFSYNFWSLAGWWIPDATRFFGLTYQTWGLVLYLIMLIVILIPFIKKFHFDNGQIYFAISLAIFTFFLFLTRIHQRYLFPFFAFLLIAALLKNLLKLKILYGILSFIHLINLAFVYYYYNFVYQNPKFVSSIFYKFLNENYNLLTSLNLLGFLFLILIYYNSKNSAKINA